MQEMLTETKKNNPLVDLVSVALKQDKLSGLSEMLKKVAESLNAYGCVLWEVVPGSALDATPPKGQMFVLDQWLEDDNHYALYDLKINSAAGWVVLNKKVRKIDDVYQDEYVRKDPTYVEHLGIKTVLLIPLTFPDTTRQGVLAIYRKQHQPFTAREVEITEELALLIPVLYQTIRAKVVFDLTDSINKVLQKIQPASETNKSHKNIKKAIEDICHLIRNTFDCIEVSIFLKDLDTDQKLYKLMATTWPEKFEKKTYSKTEKRLTSWVLKSAKPVRIFDLANFERDKDNIRHIYPNIKWTDSLDIQSAVRRFLKLKPTDALPPLSFMAAPIVLGKNVFGVIRCCTAKTGPRYFSERDRDLLMLIASQIGQAWGKWLSELEIQEENNSWRTLVAKIGELNKLVLNELKHEIANENRIFQKALQITRESIKGADICAIRLTDEAKQELHFAETLGAAWNIGNQQKIRERRQTSFPINKEMPASAGAFVFREGKVHLIRDVKSDPYFANKMLFPGVKKMIVAPIKVADEVLGVMDILSTQKQPFPINAVGIAELVGQQIGLYRFLINAVGMLHKAENHLRQQIRERSQMLEDLAHQIKSPIIQAFARANIALKNEADEKKNSNLLAVRGLSAKAKKVAMSMKLLATLAQEESLEVKPKFLQLDYIVKMLIEAARDNQLMIDPSRRIKVTVMRETFPLNELTKVLVDYDLLEQAVGNLLDNAIKYSYTNTEILIYSGLTHIGRWHLTFVNYGLPIGNSEVSSCITRGWRSKNARLVAGEGSGIGLWIVDSIMKSHNGELVIMPTKPNNKTEVKLVFPLSKETGESI